MHIATKPRKSASTKAKKKKKKRTEINTHTDMIANFVFCNSLSACTIKIHLKVLKMAGQESVYNGKLCLGKHYASLSRLNLMPPDQEQQSQMFAFKR